MRIKINNGHVGRLSGNGVRGLHSIEKVKPTTNDRPDDSNLKQLRNTLKTLILDKKGDIKQEPTRGTGIVGQSPNKKKKYITF